jgi:hypothetical protein
MLDTVSPFRTPALVQADQMTAIGALAANGHAAAAPPKSVRNLPFHRHTKAATVMIMDRTDGPEAPQAGSWPMSALGQKQT